MLGIKSKVIIYKASAQPIIRFLQSLSKSNLKARKVSPSAYFSSLVFIFGATLVLGWEVSLRGPHGDHEKQEKLQLFKPSPF